MVNKVSGIFFSLLLVFPLQAQNTLSIIRLRDLNAGIIIAGSQKEISPGSPESAWFEIQSSRNDQLNLRFTLPSFLAASGAQVAINFSTIMACWAYKISPGIRNTFDPRQGTVLNISAGEPVYVWLGSSSTISSQQQAGNYTNILTLTATSTSP